MSKKLSLSAEENRAIETCLDLENLIPEKFLRLAEVMRRYPLCRSSIYKLISLGQFPAPHRLGARAVAWLESDINKFIASRVANARAEVK